MIVVFLISHKTVNESYIIIHTFSKLILFYFIKGSVFKRFANQGNTMMTLAYEIKLSIVTNIILKIIYSIYFV